MHAQTDLKSTLNLPQTTFKMKAGLPQTEPRRLEVWEEQGLYAQIRAARKGAPRFVLHDGPPYANGHLHLGTGLNKILKDIVVRSRTMAGFDAPYRPGWDCHGLPIELHVDRSVGSQKHAMSAVEFRRACRAYAEKFVDIQRSEFRRLGVMGEWDTPYLTMDPHYQATIVRQLARAIETGIVYKAKKSVHWCISCATALAEAEVEYDENHESPSIDVRFQLRDKDAARLAKEHPALTGKMIDAVIWTTTPWTIPANLALAFHPDVDYVFKPVEGETDAVLLLADALTEAAQQRWGDVTLGETIAKTKGAQLEGLRFRHPWIDRDSPGVLADYVTLETGTGVVHTAPGHGWDDYLTGLRYDLDVYCPVDESGRFTNEVPEFEGQRVFDANPAVIELLREKGRLLQAGTQSHSYPVCWRCKKPIIFRATSQWFIGLDRNDLRQKALAAIGTVRWHPAWGEERIRNMIANRPDWCISRQRLWGVPIPAVYCRTCEKPILTAEIARRVADEFAASSADAWYEREASAFLPDDFRCECGGAEFDKETDILDVWFDSGSSWAAVVGGTADVYLEGSDQHRGWFHSSLLISVANRSEAPYRQVITHGFTVDGDGRKMSKSLGNVVAPQKIADRFGAEILRLWVTMVDYREDMPISEEMFSRLGEAYRKIRNTCRYALSNLGAFDVAQHGVPEAELDEIDRFALANHRRFVARVRKAYDEFEFHVVYHQLLQYCSVDLSAFYFDVLKDRLYCDATNGARRRSALTVLHRIAHDVTRLMAPALPFTADEVWELLPGTPHPSVHLALFPDVEAPDAAVLERWELLLEARSAAMKALEEARAGKTIGSSLGAEIEIRAPEAMRAALAEHESRSVHWPGELASLFIVSRAVLRDDPGPLSVTVKPATGNKCERCWTVAEEVGQQNVHPAVCPRCATVLETL